MKSYPATEADIETYVASNASVIAKPGPEQVVSTLNSANEYRKRMTSTWYGLIMFVFGCVIAVVLVVLSLSTLFTASTFSKIKVLLVTIILVCVWFFMLR